MYFFKQTHQSGLIKPKQSASANCMPKLLLKKYMAWHAQVQQLPSQFRQCNNPMHTSSHRIRRAGSTLPVMALLLVLMSVLALSRHTNHSHAKTTTKPATTQQLAFTTSTEESAFQLGRTADYDLCTAEPALRFVRARSDGVLDRVYMNLKARYQLSFSPGQDIELLIT